MTTLHFNYKDVFRAGRLGFSAKKIWVSFLGLLIAFIGYGILSYIAYISAGVEFGEVWDTFRLVPVYPSGLPWYSWIIWVVGLLWWICVALITGTAVSKITYEQLKGDEFYEIKEAIKFALKHSKSVILAPAVLILFIIALLVMGIILALITWVPYFGQLFLAVMAVPAFAVSLFILYLVIVTVVCLVIGPSIVGETGNDTFDTLFESFSVINDQPWRFIGYEILLKIVIVIGVVILGFFAAKAIFLGNTVLGIIVPADKLDNIFSNASYYVKITIPSICPEWWNNLVTGYLDWIGMPNILYPPDYIAAYEAWAGAIASFIMGIIYYLIILFVVSLGKAIFWSGNTLIFTVLVKKKDDKNLLEIKEETFEEPEPITEPKPTEEKEKKTKRRAKETKEKSAPETEN
ncbi:hypothetical protein BXT86_04330 [candidate division WOR-3 bacterium 4484_100]|uniref:Glycerophosphoryl diester phosphodiesterase membrane domain-containing protein n=1 Tax=candidate division WOR-3 bacterium 4484_100 TaxID=1936077 RepID=A0A1V4QER9_UNCW3|nr:MAG: hypothetical protein BXT86_04330 [candidate division WOR-3 bacterium 4484_100]